jgi:hypothetical protein
MAKNRGLPLVLKFLSWLGSALGGIRRSFARRKDERLNKYHCSLSWTEQGQGVVVTVDVKAETHEQARQFANNESIKKLPTLKSMVGSKEFHPPYMGDAKAALREWKIEAVTRTDEDRAKIADGEFGPAGAYNPPGWSSG